MELHYLVLIQNRSPLNLAAHVVTPCNIGTSTRNGTTASFESYISRTKRGGWMLTLQNFGTKVRKVFGFLADCESKSVCNMQI